MTAATERRLWLAAGWLLIGYIVLTFAGVVFQHSLELGDAPSKATSALVTSSMAKNFAGGYIEFLSQLLFLVGALLLARLLRGDGALGEWLSSCMTAAVTAAVSVTVAVGFAAGAAALYDGHHGASLATVTTVNDIRNFGFYLTGGLVGVFALAAAAAIRLTGALPRWVAYTGVIIGVLSIAAIPATSKGAVNASTLLGFAWIVAVGVTSLRRARRTALPATARTLAASV